MLIRVDRIQVAVSDSERAADIWEEVLGAAVVREDGVESLRSHRTVLGLGSSEVELLRPTGPGPVADHLGAWGEGIFSAGFAVAGIAAARDRLADAGVRWTEEGEQILVDASEIGGLGCVLTPDRPTHAPAAVSGLYEVTHLVHNWKEAQEAHSRVFGLDPSGFSEIESGHYGYTGSLLLFDPPQRLDRIELAQVVESDLAMGRFVRRHGESIYMCYAECDDVPALIARLRDCGARFDAPSDDADPPNLFVHPKALTGVLMGVSRTHHAWTWSGRPELARGS